MAPTLLWVGLGNMGRAMCKVLVEKGNLDSPLLIYNRSIQRTKDLNSALPAGKTEVVEDLAAAVAKADIIFTCLANDEAVRESLGAILKASVAGKLFVESSTVHPDTTEEMAALVTAQGGELIAGPVFGPPAAAAVGALVGVLAGPKSAIDRARPYFKGVLTRADIEFPDQPLRKAGTLKVLGNTFVLNMVEQLAEAYVAAEKSGLGTGPMFEFVDAVFPGPYSAYSERLLSGDYYNRAEPLFAVDLARKDARHALDLAKSAGVRLRNVETGDAHLAQVKEHCGPTGDLAGIYGVVRKESGLKFENQ